jgi:hypothetical protein
MSLTDEMPVYVTRPTAGGETGSMTISAWVPLVVMILTALNLIVWGTIGLVFAGVLIVQAIV